VHTKKGLKHTFLDPFCVLGSVKNTSLDTQKWPDLHVSVHKNAWFWGVKVANLHASVHKNAWFWGVKVANLHASVHKNTHFLCVNDVIYTSLCTNFLVTNLCAYAKFFVTRFFVKKNFARVLKIFLWKKISRKKKKCAHFFIRVY
jgi:hypothetical protein